MDGCLRAEQMSRILSFRFDTFGDVVIASSRLRAWKLSEFLRAVRAPRDDERRRAVRRLCLSKSQAVCFASRIAKAGALVVYDFDDHLLLEGAEGHGVREEVVAFMNFG